MKRNGIGAGNPANNSKRTRQTGFYRFDHAITSAIYFTLHNGKKSSLDRPNYTSIQVYHILRFMSRKNVKKKFILTNKIFFVTSIQFVACALRENLSNRSSGVQVPRDICTRFERYLHSTKCSWIINLSIETLTIYFNLMEQIFHCVVIPNSVSEFLVKEHDPHII